MVKNLIFFSKISNKTRITTLITQHGLFNIVFRVLATEEKKKIQGIQIGKEEVKFSPFADDMILNTVNPEDVSRKLLELLKDSIKLQDTKLIYRNYCISKL